MESLLLAPIFAGGFSILFSIILIFYVLKQEKGTTRMQEISEGIKEGAKVYLDTQYKIMSICIILLGILLALVINMETALSFFAGSALSALTGYMGMNLSVRANVRVANAAKEGLKGALKLAVRGGAVTGMFAIGFALLGISLFYLVYKNPLLIVGFGFGACLVSLFARIGGGIYTKVADIGADLVGKVEKGIPEDDPRNPAVIADLVGDNVGDCAGMAADLFETYAVTLIAAMLLGFLFFKDSPAYVVYPLMIGVVGIIACIIGSISVSFRRSIMTSLYISLAITGVVAIVGCYFITKTLVHLNLFYATLVGIFVTIGLFIITEYYTSKKYTSVKEIASASQSGAAINILTGLSKGMESVVAPTIIIAVGIFLSYWFGGVYGIGIATMAMLSLTGMIITLDSYGPITDNAAGITEMAGLPKRMRRVTDALDAVGNTTKAVTKAFAIGSAALASLTLFATYQQETYLPSTAFTIADPVVLIGLFIGALIPFLFSSLCLGTVSRSAFLVVKEVRRQFKEIKGLLEGRAKPEYGNCVKIVTKAGLRGMILPVILAIASPILIGLILGPKALGGLLLGCIITGLFLALQMATGGAAWDNAKKCIEEGKFGGKGSEPHKASVIGDTIGDPMKDTAAPAINPLIKVINTVAIIFIPIILTYTLV